MSCRPPLSCQIPIWPLLIHRGFWRPEVNAASHTVAGVRVPSKLGGGPPDVRAPPRPPRPPAPAHSVPQRGPTLRPPAWTEAALRPPAGSRSKSRAEGSAASPTPRELALPVPVGDLTWPRPLRWIAGPGDLTSCQVRTKGGSAQQRCGGTRDGLSPIRNGATPSSPLLTASSPQKNQDWILHTDDFYLKIPKDTKINFNNIYYLIYYSIHNYYSIVSITKKEEEKYKGSRRPNIYKYYKIY